MGMPDKRPCCSFCFPCPNPRPILHQTLLLGICFQLDFFSESFSYCSCMWIHVFIVFSTHLKAWRTNREAPILLVGLWKRLHSGGTRFISIVDVFQGGHIGGKRRLKAIRASGWWPLFVIAILNLLFARNLVQNKWRLEHFPHHLQKKAYSPTNRKDFFFQIQVRIQISIMYGYLRKFLFSYTYSINQGGRNFYI